MKRRKLLRSALSLVLTLAMLLPVLPAARAADEKCECGANCTSVVMMEANCQQVGIIKYICTSASCGKETLKEVPKNPSNHDSICVDSGDGATHIATCRVCPTYRNISEPHTFVDGHCTKCEAADYTKAVIHMPSSIELYVDLNDTQAAISIGDVTMKVGNVDVSDSYTFSYGWMDQNGTTVSTSATYLLPASLTAKVGDYSFGCFVVAMPKGITSGKFVSQSCTVTVHVRDLITASAVVSSDVTDFAMGATNGRTAISIMQQIYQAAYNLSDGYPSFVVFGEPPLSTVGRLDVLGSRYYFSPTTGQLDLSQLKFVPSGDSTGSYAINFTVYDTKGNDFPGVLTILVEHNFGAVDLSYIAEKGHPISLDAKDFEAFWQGVYSNGSLTLVAFGQLPAVHEGTLYYNYSPISQTGALVKTSDMFYSTYSATTQYLLDAVTFIPDSKHTGIVTIPFAAYGLNNLGKNSWLEGKLAFFISTGDIKEVTCKVDSGKTMTLSAADFLAAYQHVAGSNATNFCIKLLDVPKNGALYLDYTGGTRDTALTTAALANYSFYYSSALSKEISDLTYVAPTTTTELSDTLRYIAFDHKGVFQFVGEIKLTVKPTIKVYTKYFPDVLKTPSSEWYYTAVMDLAEAGVIGGFDDGTFKPQGEVTYAQALKLIMLAAGYPTPIQTSTHWASGYLALAHANGLLSTSITESYLDRKIDRNTIAQIAAKAMSLPASTITVSPFADVTVGTTYASYIFSLYEAGIITGSPNPKGEMVYYGINSITRAEMSVIVWRIMNYKNA